MDKDGFVKYVSRKPIKIKARLLEEEEVIFSVHGKQFVPEGYYQIITELGKSEFYMSKSLFHSIYIEESIA